MAQDDPYSALSGATASEFQPTGNQPAASDAFQPAGDEQPNLIKHDPVTYGMLSLHQKLKDLQSGGFFVSGDQAVDMFNKAWEQSSNFQADIAKAEEAKALELRQRAAATVRGPATQQYPQGTPSLLEQEETERAGIAQLKEQQQEQFKQGPVASAEAAQLSQQAGHPVFIQQLPTDQRTQLAQIQTGYERLNNMQTLYGNLVKSAPLVAGGLLQNKIGALVSQPGAWNTAAKDFNAYQDESVTPLAVAVFGDKASSATKDKQVEMLKETLIQPGDTLEQAGHKIFMQKNTLMERLNAMKNANQGTISTGEINNTINQLTPDFTSKETQANNMYAPKPPPVVQVGNSAQGKAQIAAAASAGATPAPTVTPTPTPLPAPTVGMFGQNLQNQ